MEWTDEIIDRLKALWLEGHSTAEIGRRMGISKNAVVGKAHRLVLAGRPSPIRRGPPGERPRRPSVKRVTGPTLPTMEAPAARDAVPATSSPPPSSPPSGPAPLRAVRTTGGARLIACCWPIGEPGTRSFKFCDDESLPGKPYCSAHAALAYVRVKDKREEAA